MNAAESAIARFLLENQLAGSGLQNIGLDDPLIRSGLLDSMGLLQLVSFIEEHFGVTVGDGELVPENFETIHQVTSFIGRKKAG